MEQPQTQEQTAGSLTSSGTAVRLKPLRDALKELEDAYELARASRSAFSEMLKAVSEKSGVEPAVIRAFVAARMSENAEQAEARAERARQLALVFDEVGA